MFRIVIIPIVMFLSACAAIPKFRDAIPDSEKRFQYNVMHAIPKHLAFSYSRQWIATDFNSAKDVIQFEDSTTGVIVVKGLIEWHFPVDALKTQFWDGYQEFTMTLNVVDSNSVIEFEHGVSRSTTAGMGGKYYPSESMAELIAQFQAMRDRYTEFMRLRKR